MTGLPQPFATCPFAFSDGDSDDELARGWKSGDVELDSYSRSGRRIENVFFERRSCSAVEVPNRLDEAIPVSEPIVSSLCRLRALSFAVSDESQIEESASKQYLPQQAKGAQEQISGNCGSASILFSPSSSDLGRVAGTRGLVPVVWDLSDGETFVDRELIALSH